MIVSCILYFPNTFLPILFTIINFYFCSQERTSTIFHDHNYLLTCIWTLLFLFPFFNYVPIPLLLYQILSSLALSKTVSQQFLPLFCFISFPHWVMPMRIQGDSYFSHQTFKNSLKKAFNLSILAPHLPFSLQLNLLEGFQY